MITDREELFLLGEQKGICDNGRPRDLFTRPTTLYESIDRTILFIRDANDGILIYSRHLPFDDENSLMIGNKCHSIFDNDDEEGNANERERERMVLNRSFRSLDMK